MNIDLGPMDVIEIHDGDSPDGPLLARYTYANNDGAYLKHDSEYPPEGHQYVFSTDNKIYVILRTYSSVKGTGFNFQYWQGTCIFCYRYCEYFQYWEFGKLRLYFVIVIVNISSIGKVHVYFVIVIVNISSTKMYWQGTCIFCYRYCEYFQYWQGTCIFCYRYCEYFQHWQGRFIFCYLVFNIYFGNHWSDFEEIMIRVFIQELPYSRDMAVRGLTTSKQYLLTKKLVVMFLIKLLDNHHTFMKF